MMIYHPYGCDWGSMLDRVTHLETFKIHVIFQGHLDVHPASFGQQWGQIFSPSILSGNYPEKVVEVVVQAKTVAREVSDEVRGSDALRFIDHVRLHVYPSQFQWLQEAAGPHTAQFSFKSEAIIQNADCRCWRHRGFNTR